MTARPFWEKVYTDLHTATFGGPSQEIRDVVASLPAGGKAVDPGCGEGRNSLFLAACGFDVTAVDISGAGIRKLDALAKDRRLKVLSEVADMRRYRFRQQYDLIVSHGCLHLIERKSWQELIRLFKIHTKPGGINVVVVFTDAIPPPDDLRDYCLGLFREGELFTLYSDWESVLQKSYTLEDEHPGGLRHRHSVNKLVARRASSSALHGD
jgi:tellurite methyltransferase